MKPMTASDLFLKSFCEIELSWIADKNYQMQAWSIAQGDNWSTCIMLYSEAWATISRNRTNYKLYFHEFQLFEKLYEMIKAFERYFPHFPEKPAQHIALLNDPEWKKIQQFAKEIYDKIYPRLTAVMA